jgi:L-aspartate oxidase
MKDCIETDILIIGSGIAGCVSALRLAEAGINVTIVTRTEIASDSTTYNAQGGIIYAGVDDSKEILKEDIIRAGAGFCNPEAVSILVEEGPSLVKELLINKLNVGFDTEKDGSLALTSEGSHSIPRILHVADATGKAIEDELIKILKTKKNITLLTGFTATDLLTPHHHSLNRLVVYEPQSCVGAYLLNQKQQKVIRCIAKNIILATGGLGQIFLRTTNPSGARGDGIAMANRCGARVLNNEFVQFHPTTFFARSAPQFLISEAVRGEGARLVNFDGKPFMENYDPEWKDLAPRDVVSRSIHNEMLVHDVPNVYLDLYSNIPTEKIKVHFPNIYEKCLTFGVNITKSLVPVVPAAHYACGGVWVDEWGQTTIQNLYAVGEVACTGVHGANRLASASLLEALVWADRAARHIIKNISTHKTFDAKLIPAWKDTSEKKPDPALISQDMSHIKHIMWNYVGLIRNTRRLKRALRELRNLENEIESFYRAIRVTDSLIGLRNAVRTAIIVTAAAWANKSSVGCHFRED